MNKYLFGCRLVVELYSLEGTFIKVLLDDKYDQHQGAVGVYIMFCTIHERQGLRVQARLYEVKANTSRNLYLTAARELKIASAGSDPFVYLTHDHINDGPVRRTNVDKHGGQHKVGGKKGYVPPIRREHS